MMQCASDMVGIGPSGHAAIGPFSVSGAVGEGCSCAERLQSAAAKGAL